MRGTPLPDIERISRLWMSTTAATLVAESAAELAKLEVVRFMVAKNIRHNVAKAEAA